MNWEIHNGLLTKKTIFINLKINISCGSLCIIYCINPILILWQKNVTGYLFVLDYYIVKIYCDWNVVNLTNNNLTLRTIYNHNDFKKYIYHKCSYLFKIRPKLIGCRINMFYRVFWNASILTIWFHFKKWRKRKPY